MGRLGSGHHVVGRLGSGMQVSASFQIIPLPVGLLQLVLGSELHVMSRLGSGPRVEVGEVISGGLPPGGVVSGGVISYNHL